MPNNHTLVFCNFVGGVGKSSLATSYAMERDLMIITNDSLEQYQNIDTVDVVALPHKKKRIDKALLHTDNIVYDYGSTQGSIDFKLIDAVKNSDGLVIPTLTTLASIRRTIAFIKAIKPYKDNIVVVINMVPGTKAKRKQFEKAKTLLSDIVLGSHILMMKQTTLYSRIEEDGSEWYKSIKNDKGEYQLNKAYNFQNELFHKIDELIIAGNRMY